MTDVVVCDFMHDAEVVAEQRRGRMKYCGIDVGGTNWVSIEDENGKKLKRFEIGHSREDFEKIESFIDKDTEICLEDTGVYSHPLFEYFRSKGYSIRRINGWKAKHLRKFIKGRMKTDLNDCEVLAKVKKVEAITGETTTYADYETSPLKNCARAYWNLTNQLSKLKSKIKQTIFLICPELRKNFSDAFCLSILYLLRYLTITELKKLTPEEILEKLRKHEKTVSITNIRKVQESLRDSIGLFGYQDANFNVLTDLYLGLYESSLKLSRQMQEEILKTDYAELLNLPHVGATIAGIVIGEIGDIDKFPNHKKFVNYCGYDFAKEQSCSKDKEYMGRTGSLIRDTLSTVAMSFIKDKDNNKFKKFHAHLKNRGKKPKICFNAAKRKLLVWLYYEMKKAKKRSKEGGYKFQIEKVPKHKRSEESAELTRLRKERYYWRHREKLVQQMRDQREKYTQYKREWRQRKKLEFQERLKAIVN